MPYKLVVFDMDGVFVNINSSWVWVHDHFKVQNKQSVQEYLRGKINDIELMKSDIELWLKRKKNIHISYIEKILSSAPMVKGGEETIRILKANNIETAILTSGIDVLANIVGAKMGIEIILANGIEIDKNGYLTGNSIMRVELRNKGIALQELISKTGFSPMVCVAVGNSYSDVPMFRLCGLGIAFNHVDEITKEVADVVIESGNLTSILPYILKESQSVDSIEDPAINIKGVKTNVGSTKR
jgi:phosphoserine phosphatase